MGTAIDGRAIAQKVYAELRDEIASLKSRGATPGLAVVLVGDDPASRAYVRAKDKMCRELGLHSVKLELPATTKQEELLARVDELNRDEKIHGILVQSPPPPQINEAAIIRALDSRKTWMDFTRSMSQSSRLTMIPALFRAPPSLAGGSSAKRASHSPAPTSLSLVAA